MPVLSHCEECGTGLVCSCCDRLITATNDYNAALEEAAKVAMSFHGDTETYEDWRTQEIADAIRALKRDT